MSASQPSTTINQQPKQYVYTHILLQIPDYALYPDAEAKREWKPRESSLLDVVVDKEAKQSNTKNIVYYIQEHINNL